MSFGMTMKYFYVEDDTAVLFAANGTALTVLLVGVTDIVPLVKFPIPTYPIWLYFFGLIFAFLSKAMIQLINGDILQREKLQNARDVMMAAEKQPDLPEQISAQLEAVWKFMEQRHKTLLKLEHGPRIDKLRALFFFLSSLSFLFATSKLIYLAGLLMAQRQ
jgi:hypothetical protein